MTVSQNIVLELKKLGIVIDHPPTKLKSGAGDAVCQALAELTRATLMNLKFSFANPIIPDDDEGMNEDLDDGDDIEGTADIADMVNEDIEEDEDIAELVESGDPKAMDVEQQQQIIESQIDPDDWMRECQRVAHRLKIKNTGDAKEWRNHLDQTKKYAENVKGTLPDVRHKLEKISDEVSRTLETIMKKEQVLNKGFSNMTGDYKNSAQNSKELENEYNRLNSKTQEMESQLYDINEKLAEINKKMDEVGKNISDTQPLMQIKKAITGIKNDIRNIDIRVGVVSNTLLQCKLKERNSSQDDVKKGGLELENDYGVLEV